MAQSVDLMLVLAMLLNFLVLGSSRLRACIRAVAVQGVLLSLLPLLLHLPQPAFPISAGFGIMFAPPFRGANMSSGLGVHTIALSAGMLAFKGVLFPWLLLRTLRDGSMRGEIKPLIGFTASLLVGAVATVVAFLLSSRLPSLPSMTSSLVVPAAMATLLISLVVLVSRTKALMQVLGYLMLENGIFLFGLTLVQSMPLLVELGVLLDLFAGVFIMGIVIYHISREFDHIDTSHLTTLKD